MDGSREDEASCSYSNVPNIIAFVKKRIEYCIKNYMSFEETANYLLDKDNTSHYITKTFWEQLQQESPEFFNNYNLRCKTIVQAKMLKDLVEKHAALVNEHTRAPDNAEPSHPNLAWYNANGPSVIPQMPNDQQNQFQPFSESFAVPVANGSSVTQNDQQGQFHQCPWSTSNHLAYTPLGPPTLAPAFTDPAYGYPGAPTNELPDDQWCPYDDLFSLASTMPEERSTVGFGSDIGHNGPSYQDMDMVLAAQLLLQSNGQIQDLSRLYPPHLQLQQNFSVEAPKTPQCGGESNGQQNGGVSNGLQNGGVSNGLENGGGSNRFHSGGLSNGLDNGGVSNRLENGGGSNRMHSGGGSNRFHSVGVSNGLENGGVSNGLDNGGVSNELDNGGVSNGLDNGGVSNGLDNGGVSNGLDNGGGSNRFHSGGVSNGLDNGGVSNRMHSGGGSNRFHSVGVSNGLDNGGVSNGVQNGETTHQQLWALLKNFDTNQSWRLHTSVDEQHARGVKRHHPESEALNNPDTGDGTLERAQNQHGDSKRKNKDGP